MDDAAHRSRRLMTVKAPHSKHQPVRAALIGLLAKPLGECRSLFVRRRRGAVDDPRGTLGAMGQ